MYQRLVWYDVGYGAMLSESLRSAEEKKKRRKEGKKKGKKKKDGCKSKLSDKWRVGIFIHIPI